jgi:23S rRNA pseudouridine1911/1915/1917 synthase
MQRAVGETKDLKIEGGTTDAARVFLGSDAGDDIEVLHEDDRLIAVSKPCGLPVVPDRGKSQGSVLGRLLRREIAERSSKPPEAWFRPRIVHRIDRLTSGLVIVAKTPEVERRLGADFEARRVKKEYFAVLEGIVAAARVTVNCPIVPGRKGKMRAEADGPASLTEFDVLARLKAQTLAAARPFTGRTHQIRVHAWAMGHPLAVDPLYNPRGAGLDGLAPERLTLHALRYELPEDWDDPRAFECPLAGDLAAAVEGLRRG